jgi:hypothetical protein
MRTIGAVFLLIGILAVGFVALSYAGVGVQDAATDNGTNASSDVFNITTGVHEVAGQSLALVATLGGVVGAAFALFGWAFLGGGRR